MTIECPTPHHDDEVVLLGHGAGGRLTAELGAVRLGEVQADGPAGRVTLRTLVGARRIVEMPLGEQLPRIC